MPFARIRKALIAIVLIVIGLLSAQAQGVQPVPPLTGHVNDTTGTLDAAQAAALEAKLAALEADKGSQVVVLVVPSTAPEDIASYAFRVASTWKIGRRDVGDGLLVVVAKNDRRMRIEVARKLEGAIPDLAASRIIDQAMAPRFREGDYAGGISAALDQIGARIADEALPAPAQQGAAGGDQGFDLGQLAIFLFFGVMVAGPVVRRLFGGRFGSVVMGGGTGALAYLLTASALLAGGAGIAALLLTLLSNSRGGGGGSGRGGGGPFIGGGGLGGLGGGFGGGRGSGGFGGGGGFSSGGGGSFGGGGASGGW